MQRLDGLVNYADALRERSHEFMNKLHVILGLLHLKSYKQLEDYIPVSYTHLDVYKRQLLYNTDFIKKTLDVKSIHFDSAWVPYTLSLIHI